MMTDVSIVQIIRWIVYFFPSVYDYAKIVAPILILFVSTTSVFMNIIPSPGQIYPVPSREDIELELKDKAVIYRLTLFTRYITLKVNAVVKSRPYKWFYKIASLITRVVNKIRGVSSKKTDISITKPGVFEIEFDSSKNKK